MDTLWEFAAAKEKRDAGITKSSETAGENWKKYAIGFVRLYLERNATLFVDDLWDAGLQEPASSRALGAVIQYAAAQNWIRKQFSHGLILSRPSTRSNLQLKPVWKSNLYAK